MPRFDPNNRSRYWEDRMIPGLSLLEAEFTTHEYAPHMHDAMVIAVTQEGGANFRSRGVSDQATASRLLVFNPQEPHSGRMGASERWHYRGLYLEEAALDRICATLGMDRPSYFTSNIFQDAELVRAFLSLHRALDAGVAAIERDELLCGAFGRLYTQFGSDRKPPVVDLRDRRITDAVLELMTERHGDDIGLEDLADSVDVTPFQLIRIFNRTVSLSPHACLIQIRLRTACRLMKLGGRSLAEIALATGFYDQSALHRHFKRAYGITPMQYVQAAGC